MSQCGTRRAISAEWAAAVSVQGESGQSLLDLLRNTLQLKATRMGCGQGQCGACRVMLDGHAVAVL
jgi:nicotinate dehydrogenase subunit A